MEEEPSRKEENPQPRKRKEPSTEDSVKHRVEVLAQWSSCSDKIFKLEEELKKAKQIQVKLEETNPWLGQVKGLVRGGERRKKEEKAVGKKETEPPKKKKLESSELEGVLPQRDPHQRVRKTVERRLKEIEEKGKVPRWNPDYSRHTWDQMRIVDPSYLDEEDK